MANKHKNVIELNGKLYDTKQGVPLSESTPSARVSHVIDGFIAPKPHTVISPIKSQPPAPKTLKPIKHRQTNNLRTRRTPQKSTILMRQSVKKPAAAEKAPVIAPFSPKSRVHIRADRANNAAKSPYISKYHSRVNAHRVTRRTEPIAVATPPDRKPHHPRQTEMSRPPVKHVQQSAQSEKLFNEALQKTANHPKQKHTTKKRRKAVGWGSSIIAGLLLVGFITYINLPNLNVKFAGTQAGFAASMPGYKPSGYTFNGPVSYEAGKVTISFKSNTDDRSYTVKQEVSNWNSQSLQENFLAANDKTFTTTQEGGRTVYMYDDGNATWVNGGIWYQVESNSLSSDQLLGIANSI